MKSQNKPRPHGPSTSRRYGPAFTWSRSSASSFTCAFNVLAYRQNFKFVLPKRQEPPRTPHKPHRDSGFLWTQPEVALCKQLYTEGFTAAEIAVDLLVQYGKRRTRSAVLGQLHRIGLKKTPEARLAAQLRAFKYQPRARTYA